MPIAGINAAAVRGCLAEVESHLHKELLPFWIQRSPDLEYGGFLTHFDRNGQPTGETSKTLVSQLRMIFTMASAHRAGLGGGQCAELARQGVDFLLENFWDAEHDGWYWICNRDGMPTVGEKVMYGHAFGVYALAEYGLATGDPRGREWAERTFDVIQKFATDTRNGGYFELFKPDWRIQDPGPYGGDRKSLDVHMHLMEAFTTLYELTGDALHLRKLNEVMGVLFECMLDPDHGTGIAQLALDFTPLPAIMFKTVWGSDRDPEDAARPLNNTSFGHNVEFAWLLLHTADILGEPRESYRVIFEQQVAHALKYGVDREHGGVYVEGPHDGPATPTEKEFWQNAEVLIGFLDACLLLRDSAYWDGYVNVHRFVFDHFVNHGVGEWFALLERDGTVRWDYMGHAWKISYHTVRSMIQSARRLRALAEVAEGQDPDAVSSDSPSR